MNKATKINLEAYGRTAGKLADIYNNLSTETVLPGLAERLPVSSPTQPLRALDLGCGSGRDAVWLAEKGFDVVAIDGAPEMIAVALAQKSHPKVTYFDDVLPEIEKVMALGEKFDVIIMSAVWMHLDTAERRILADNLAALASKDALIYISLRHGESPADRPMFETSAQELARLAQERGMRCEYLGSDEDHQGRRGKVFWEYVALKR